MKVWKVGVSDCESCSTFAICSTKEIALREMFKKRDLLISEWKEMQIHNKESEKKFLEEQAKKGIYYGFSGNERDMYGDMIKNLSHDDYEKWENYPQEVPWISETEVIDK